MDDAFRMKWINKYPAIILLAIAFFLFLAADGLRVINYPPRSTHIFRQSDCLAYTKTYYQHNSGLFSPAGYNLIGKEGRVVSEFPILYYVSAKLCRLFGFQYWIIRGVTFLCYLFGLYYLLLISRFWIKDIVLALFPIIILATSPYFFFYGVNYLPNIPAISLSFGGLYYLLLYERQGAAKHIVVGTLFFVIATLLKPTDGGVVWVAYMAYLLLDSLVKKEKSRKVAPLIISSVLIALSIVAWYLFVQSYNKENGNNINLQGIFPIWEMSMHDIVDTIKFRVVDMGQHCFQHISLLFLLVGFLVIYIVKWRALNRFLKQFTLALMLGSVVYAVLWYQAFFIHDYYQLLFAIPAAFLSITVCAYFEKVISTHLQKTARYVVNILLVGFMLIGIYHNQAVQIDNYSDANVGFNNITTIYEVEPYLRKLGITPDDIILSVPDGSPNITLVAYGNKGFSSDLFHEGDNRPEVSKAKGAKYMIVSGKKYLQNPYYAPFTTKLMGVYKDIYIFDIR